MKIKVITPPEPFLTPADIAGSHSADDATIAAMIEAATEELDGYTGWLGRCLGPQEIECVGWFPCAIIELPIGPVLEVVSIAAEDATGVVTEVDPSTYRLSDGVIKVAPGAAWVSEPIHRIRYWAGYGERNSEDATKWDVKVPQRVKQAVILSVQHMKALGAENLFLRSEEVEGIGSRTYTVSEQAGAVIHDAARRLLSGLKVRRV